MNAAKFTLKAKNSRALLRSEKDGVLSTMSLELPGYPFGSVTPYSIDEKGRPVILISDLAQHTRNIISNQKVSLTVLAAPEEGDVQANARLTYLGDARILKDDEADARQRYLRKFPRAERYFEAHNFFFYVIEPVRARYIEGFGKIWWVEPEELLLDNIFNYQKESEILDHMNQDHKGALVTYCKKYNLDADKEDYVMTGIDTEGIDITVGNKSIRIHFESPLGDPSQAREVLVQMARN